MEQFYRLSAVLDYDGQVLARMTSLANRAGCRLNGLSWTNGKPADRSRLVLDVEGSSEAVDELSRNLNQVTGQEVNISDHGGDSLDWELLLVRVTTHRDGADEMLQVADLFGATLLSSDDGRLVFQVSGPAGRLAAFTKSMSGFGRLEVGRSGPVNLTRCQFSDMDRQGETGSAVPAFADEMVHWAEA